MYHTPMIFFLTFLTFGGLTTASIGRFLPYSGFQPIPLKTPGPIDIEVSEVKNITTFPLVILMHGLEKGLVKNTGYSVDIMVDGDKTANVISGGVLGFKFYVFRKMRIYWAASPDGVAASTVNGKNGAALEICIFYYNLEYGSFRNALKFRDGLIELIFRIQVKGSVPNPLFTPLADTLKQIQNAGSVANSYVNESTGATYYCASEILMPLNPSHFISKQQFQETFLSLLDFKGEPLVNRAKQVPRGTRPVVQSAGIIRIPNVIEFPSKQS